MYNPTLPITTLTTFPPNTFLENLAIRHDNSILITTLNTNSLYLVSPSSPTLLLHIFPHSAMGIVELSPDIFIISTSLHGSPNTAALYTLDMTSYSPSSPTSYTVKHTLSIPPALFLNGSCLLPSSPPSILLADSYTASIYRVSFPENGAPQFANWITHTLLAKTTTTPEGAAWPGVNGIKYHAGYVYATSSEARIFVRIPVDLSNQTFSAGEPEVLMRGSPGDDFVIDPKGEVAYVCTNPNNSLVKIRVDGMGERGFETLVGGGADRVFAGPTACAWVRGKEGRVLVVVTNGGLIEPVGGVVEVARVLRVEVGE
ncbi:hypothetical protein MMC30_009119 [Trapelia coarctata]|nr:hypothetical protein [Trapelia coarctata]